MTTTLTPEAPVEMTQTQTPVPSLFTSPSTVTLSQAVQSTTDGFVLATLQYNSDGDSSSSQGFDDSNSNPSTVRVYASQHYDWNSDRHIRSASFLMPAPNGLSYMAGEDTTAGAPTTTVQYMGLGNTNLNAMQDWQVVSLNQATTATQDGFVVAWIDAAGDNGARGQITGTQTLSFGPTTLAGSSEHLWTPANVSVPCNSFTMPVCNNTQYQVNTTVTYGTPTFGAAFVPLDASVVQLGQFKQRTPGVVYQAQTDGFLIAYIFVLSNGERGYVDLYSNTNPIPTSSAPLASTSIHQYTYSNTYIPLNTATIPVQSGNYYTANFTQTAGDPGLSLWWVPITATPPTA